MLEVCVVVEGQTEMAFVSEVLVPHLAERLRIWPALVRKPGQPGGVPHWLVARRDILNHLKSGAGKRAVHVTTMFDYYGMPTDWPGRDNAPTKAHAERAPSIEAAMQVDIATALGTGFDDRLFRPYVQMHEFEALLFTDLLKLREPFPERDRELERLAAETSGLAPEEINDTHATAPSHRIIAHIPEYERAKRRAAPVALASIGLAKLRAACQHFDSWVAWLESLASTGHNR